MLGFSLPSFFLSSVRRNLNKEAKWFWFYQTGESNNYLVKRKFSQLNMFKMLVQPSCFEIFVTGKIIEIN